MLVTSALTGSIAGYIGFSECSPCCYPKRRVITAISAALSCGSYALLRQLFQTSIPALGASTLATYLISKHVLSPSIKFGLLYKAFYS